MSAPAALTDEQKFQRAQERLQRSSRSAEVSRPADLEVCTPLMLFYCRRIPGSAKRPKPRASSRFWTTMQRMKIRTRPLLLSCRPVPQ